MAEHNETGYLGEQEAALYLEGKGYQILARQYRYLHAEIDIIAKKDKLLIFVEVKTRRWTSFGMPETFVTRDKVRLIKKAAEHFIFTHDWLWDIRFDIIAILIQEKKQNSIHHVEDAFY